MAEIIPRCNWLMLGQERTCNRIAKCEGHCDYHAKQKVKSFPCMSCGKGTRSKLGMCKSKECNYEELRYKKKKIIKIKETEEQILTKFFKKKLHAELLKKVETKY